MSYCEMSSASPYAGAKELPYELREFCVFAFEEGLYSQALSLLSNVLSAPPLAYQKEDSQVVFVPQPDILSLLGTLVVHPTLTTRASSAEKAAAADQALHFLRNVNQVAGPVNAKLSSALVFTHRARRLLKDQATTDSGQRGEVITFDRFGENGLWRRAEDFWHTVGWAFNCSARHEKRWARWKLWLRLMLEILQDDLRERLRLATDSDVAEDSRITLIQDSLIVQYLSGPGSSHRRARRIMRAIMANGDTASKNEFKEVFRNECRERTKQQPSTIVSRKVNINENEFGDYFDEVDEDGETHDINSSSIEEAKADAKQRRSERAQTSKALQSFDSSHLSSSFDPPPLEDETAPERMEALDIRMGLLVLLCQVATSLPDEFITLDEYADVVFDAVRPLPVQAFTYFISPSPSKFPQNFHARLNMRTLGSLVLKRDRHQHPLDQDSLESFYLPSAAISGSSLDNLKTSLLLETLLRMLLDQKSFRSSEKLQQALEKGIEARQRNTSQKKASRAERRLDSAEPSIDDNLKLSAQRLRFLVQAT